MSFVCIRALVAAVVGRRHGWSKLARLGTVSSMPAAPVVLASAPLVIAEEAPVFAEIIPFARPTSESMPPPSRTPSQLAA